MGHGGAREGAGRKPRFDGHPKTRPVRVPVEVPAHLVDRWILICIHVKNLGFNIDMMSVDEIIQSYNQSIKP